jgi:hypothetical protein
MNVFDRLHRLTQRSLCRPTSPEERESSFLTES